MEFLLDDKMGIERYPVAHLGLTLDPDTEDEKLLASFSVCGKTRKIMGAGLNPLRIWVINDILVGPKGCDDAPHCLNVDCEYVKGEFKEQIKKTGLNEILDDTEEENNERIDYWRRQFELWNKELKDDWLEFGEPGDLQFYPKFAVKYSHEFGRPKNDD